MPDLRTEAFVLRRTNYGETDRILSLITREGKVDVIARGVRKEKSKLAGGVELFCLSEVTIHQKSPDALGILTSAKMLHFHRGILSDLSRLDTASRALREVARLSDHIDAPELFDLLSQIFRALDSAEAPLPLVEFYFRFNLARISGEPPNLHTDITGAKLSPDQTYIWDQTDQSLRPHPSGPLSAPHIKLLRLILSAPLSTVASVKDLDDYLDVIKRAI